MGLLVSILVLSFLIFFHELGHFLAARMFGVTVEVFSIGFGKKLFCKKYGKTNYCLSAIPLGGYVQMKGQDDLDPLKRSKDKDSYNAKKPWQRIIILFAGPFANFLLAFILYLAIAFMGVKELAPVIGKVSPNSPAKEANLKPKDKIIKINGIEIKTWGDLSEIIKNSTGTLIFTIKRGDKIKNIKVTPKIIELKNIFNETVKKRAIGIMPSGDLVTLHLGFLESLKYAYQKTIDASYLIVKGLQKLIEGIVPLNQMGGVISIVQVTSKAAEVGIAALFGLTALISVNLGVLNLLPIPALDGGHIIFNLYEMIFRKPPNEDILYKLTIGGWVLLLTLMLFTIYNDIIRIAAG